MRVALCLESLVPVQGWSGNEMREEDGCNRWWPAGRGTRMPFSVGARCDGPPMRRSSSARHGRMASCGVFSCICDVGEDGLLGCVRPGLRDPGVQPHRPLPSVSAVARGRPAIDGTREPSVACAWRSLRLHAIFVE